MSMNAFKTRLFGQTTKQLLSNPENLENTSNFWDFELILTAYKKVHIL